MKHGQLVLDSHAAPGRQGARHEAGARGAGRDEGAIPRVIWIDHVEEQTIRPCLDAGYWVGFTLYPITKCSPKRAVDMLEKYGHERILVNSSADWAERPVHAAGMHPRIPPPRPLAAGGDRGVPQQSLPVPRPESEVRHLADSRGNDRHRVGCHNLIIPHARPHHAALARPPVEVLRATGSTSMRASVPFSTATTTASISRWGSQRWHGGGCRGPDRGFLADQAADARLARRQLGPCVPGLRGRHQRPGRRADGGADQDLRDALESHGGKHGPLSPRGGGPECARRSGRGGPESLRVGDRSAVPWRRGSATAATAPTRSSRPCSSTIGSPMHVPGSFPATRLRRTRQHASAAASVAETRRSRRRISCGRSSCTSTRRSLPIARHAGRRAALDRRRGEGRGRRRALGIPAIALFRWSSRQHKSEDARQAFAADSLVCRAVQGDSPPSRAMRWASSAMWPSIPTRPTATTAWWQTAAC